MNRFSQRCNEVKAFLLEGAEKAARHQSGMSNSSEATASEATVQIYPVPALDAPAVEERSRQAAQLYGLKNQLCRRPRRSSPHDGMPSRANPLDLTTFQGSPSCVPAGPRYDLMRSSLPHTPTFRHASIRNDWQTTPRVRPPKVHRLKELCLPPSARRRTTALDDGPSP